MVRAQGVQFATGGMPLITFTLGYELYWWA